MMGGSLVREGQIEDVPFIVDMVRTGSEEGVFHAHPSRSLSVEEQRERFREFAFKNRSEGYQLLVFEVDSAIVGYIDSQVKRGVGYILGIYVRENYRAKGIGKKLMERALDSFRKKRCHKARLEVFAHNHRAVKFYKHLDFVQEGFLREDEEKKDAIIMSKFLVYALGQKT